MKVLVSSGPGVMRRSTIDAVLARSHDVRLLSEDARDAVKEWPAHVEPWPLAIADGAALDRATAGCDAIIDLGGFTLESRPDPTRVNIDAVRQLVDAAGESGVRRYTYVSSLEAEAESSPADDATRAPEALVQAFAGDWSVVRPGLVYGPGDPLVSQFLMMMRSLPAVPMLGWGAHRFQPLWHGDLAAALAASVDLESAACRQTTALAGPDSVTQDDLYDRIAQLVDRRPLRVPVPEFLSTYGAQVADLLKGRFPTAAAHLAAVNEDHAFDETAAAALSRVFGVRPTPLAEGLARLVNDQLEQLPSEGVGAFEVKRFWADIDGARHDATELMRVFRVRLQEVMPISIGLEPGSPQTIISQGATLTMALPARGNIQVRVEEVTARRVTLATLQGHPLAGVVQFSATPLATGVRFEVTTCHRSANPFDWLLLTLGGAQAQDANWRRVVENVVALSGGTSAAVETEAHELTGDSANDMDRAIGQLVQQRQESERSLQ